MTDTIWDEDFVGRNPKLASHAIDFLQEMLHTQETESEREITELKHKVEALEWELRILAEKDET